MIPDFNTFEPIYIFSIAPAIIAGGLALASTLGTNIFNKMQQDDANELTRQNNQFNQEQYLDEKNYKRELQERMFEREDNAYQRTVDDIQKSGLSALAINGTNSAGDVVTQAQMPELNSITPFQAQNMDFGQLADIIGQADERQLEKDKFEYQKEKDLSDKEYRETQAKEQTRQFNAQLQHQVDSMTQQNNQFIKQHGLEESKQAKQSEFIDAQMKNMSKLAQLEESKAKNQAIIESYAKLGGECEFFTDREKFEVANAVFTSAEQEMMKEVTDILSGNTSESKQKAKNGSGGLNVSLPKKFLNTSAGLNGSYGTSESESVSKDLVSQANAVREKFYKSHKKPILWTN